MLFQETWPEGDLAPVAPRSAARLPAGAGVRSGSVRHGCTPVRIPQPGLAPGQCVFPGPHVALQRQQQRTALQADQALQIGHAVIEQPADMPVQIRPGCDQVAVHRPMHVRSECQTITRIIVSRYRERMDVRCFHHGLTAFEQHAQAGGRTAVVIEFDHHTPKSRLADIGSRHPLACVKRQSITDGPLIAAGCVAARCNSSKFLQAAAEPADSQRVRQRQRGFWQPPWPDPALPAACRSCAGWHGRRAR